MYIFDEMSCSVVVLTLAEIWRLLFVPVSHVHAAFVLSHIQTTRSRSAPSKQGTSSGKGTRSRSRSKGSRHMQQEDEEEDKDMAEGDGETEGQMTEEADDMDCESTNDLETTEGNEAGPEASPSKPVIDSSAQNEPASPEADEEEKVPPETASAARRKSSRATRKVVKPSPTEAKVATRGKKGKFAPPAPPPAPPPKESLVHSKSAAKHNASGSKASATDEQAIGTASEAGEEEDEKASATGDDGEANGILKPKIEKVWVRSGGISSILTFECLQLTFNRARRPDSRVRYGASADSSRSRARSREHSANFLQLVSVAV